VSYWRKVRLGACRWAIVDNMVVWRSLHGERVLLLMCVRGAGRDLDLGENPITSIDAVALPSGLT
jgi:hypothetical protein